MSNGSLGDQARLRFDAIPGKKSFCFWGAAISRQTADLGQIPIRQARREWGGTGSAPTNIPAEDSISRRRSLRTRQARWSSATSLRIFQGAIPAALAFMPVLRKSRSPAQIRNQSDIFLLALRADGMTEQCRSLVDV